ncbi:hypothetical protein BJ138DRAFT_17571 [Hygrophoropsis aurantiaca]|uniref:Uncharacterized protein n=1 Tax=Hygrophoropsis aurantiaca TaxID=72124 RepID=A0ACB8AQP7_9AGAM|nr:hypothetical protein BJ138DRAFT_17571 [Hygrophoropsis aurantiaca]
MSLLQQDPNAYANEHDYQSASPSSKPLNVGVNSPFDSYEFGHLQSPPFPHTPSYNGSYQNSPYSGHSELSFDPADEVYGLFGDASNGPIIREDYDPSEYDAPNSSGLLVFDGEYMPSIDRNGAHVSVSVTPATYDQHSPNSFDYSSPSSNADDGQRSRASSVSSNHRHPTSSPRMDMAHTFENLHFESPGWPSHQLPGDRGASPPRKPQSPPQLMIPDTNGSSSRPMFQQEPPLINAPEGDGGFSSGPQLHIVPATPVSGGGAASQAVPFQSTLETLHQGSAQNGQQPRVISPPWDHQQIQHTEISQPLGVPQFHEQSAQLPYPFQHSHSNTSQGLSTPAPQVHSDPNTNFLFPNLPPRTRSKSDTSSSLRPFWNSSLMTQEQLSAMDGSALDDGAAPIERECEPNILWSSSITSLAALLRGCSSQFYERLPFARHVLNGCQPSPIQI